MTMITVDFSDYMKQMRDSARAKFPVGADGELTCDVCGTPILESEHWCRACCERRKREERVREQLERLSESWKRFAAGSGDGLGCLPSWPWARFENADWRRRCDQRLLAEIESWDPEMGPLSVFAKTGEGKTSAPVAWVHREFRRAKDAIKAQEAPRRLGWLYMTGLDLAEAVKRRRLGGEPHPLVDHAMNRNVVFLDELHAHTPPDVVMAIADARYTAGRPTVMCSGMELSEFGRHFGAACFRRFIEGGKLLDLVSKK